MSDKNDDIIERCIGSFGRWQIFVCMTVFLVKFSIAWHQLCIVFLAPPVEFRCSDPNFDNCSSECPSHEFDRSIFEETIITEWDLVCEDRAPLANLAQTTFMFGILIGNVVFGYFSDRFGRRDPLVWAVMVQVVTGIAAAFSPWLWLFITLRFLCAAATGGTMLTSFVLIMEIVGKKHRTALGVLFQMPFNIGHTIMPLFSYFLRDWHYFQMAISIPSIILVSYYWLVPESPRWLLTVGRVEDSVKIMHRAAHYNHLSTYSIKEKVNAHLQETASKQSQTGGNVYDLIRTPEMRIRTICIFVNWIVIGLVYFGVAQYVGQISGDIFINVAIAGAVQIPGNLACVFLINRLGRKWTIVLSYLLCAVFCLAITVLPPDLSWAITTCACISMMCISICFSVIYVFSGELYPTTIRNVGLGTASMFARFGSMTAPFVADLSKQTHWLSPLIFGILPLAAIAVSLRLPETLNSKLPDTIDEAELLGQSTNSVKEAAKTDNCVK